MDNVLPSDEELNLITQVLAMRVTPVSELGLVLAALRSSAATAGQRAVLPVTEAQPVRPRVKPQKAAVKVRRVRAKLAEPTVAEEFDGIDADATVPDLATPSVEPEAPPRLLRRAKVRAPDTVDARSLFGSPASEKLLSGVVKWFDSRTSKGALRLTGISSDVTLNADTMSRLGIRRLYKDQEIRASVDHQSDGNIRILSLAIPSRSEAVPGFSFTPDRGPAPRVLKARPSADVSVEVRPDLSRARDARAAAESLLGGGRGNRRPR